MASDSERQIWIETCRPITIRQPLEIAGIGENGEKGLYCAPCGGVATDDDGGNATYRIFVPSAGRYRLWGYCRWLEENTNGFLVTVGDGPASPVRKTYPAGQWQWLPLADSDFSAGLGRVTLAVNGRGFAVRRLFLCNNMARHPLQSSTELRDVFYDDFDGCDEGEFDTWSKITGSWSVHRREEDKSPASKMLVGKSTSEALIHVGDDKWQSYELMCDCRVTHASSEGTAAIKFCYDREGCGYMLRWSPFSSGGHVPMELLYEAATGIQPLDRFVVTWDASQWSELAIETWQDTICIRVNGVPVRTVDVAHARGGAIGLWLHGEIEMMIDNVQVRGRRLRKVAGEEQGLGTKSPGGEDEGGDCTR